MTPKRLLKKITRRGFGASLLGGMAARGASPLIPTTLGGAAGRDFPIAIIPDPQYLAESCPDDLGGYYAAMTNWIVANRNMVLTSRRSSFEANIKAVVGVGDCVNLTTGVNEYTNAQRAW